eukprot:scaffold950_cov360-Pavlova_lutheri.AAC.9
MHGTHPPSLVVYPQYVPRWVRGSSGATAFPFNGSLPPAPLGRSKPMCMVTLHSDGSGGYTLTSCGNPTLTNLDKVPGGASGWLRGGSTTPSRYSFHSWARGWCGASKGGSVPHSFRSGWTGTSARRRYCGISKYCSTRARKVDAWEWPVDAW